MFQYARVGAAVPRLRVADCRYNAGEICAVLSRAEKHGVRVLAFPELCITGYTCGDLFYQSALQAAAEEALGEILAHSAQMELLFALGMPVRAGNRIFNCAVLLCRGRILAVVPKTFLPNHNEFYEERWFTSGHSLLSDHTELCGQTAPMGAGILFSCPAIPGMTVGVEICEDLWCPIPPSSAQALHGANVILNLSAGNELAAKGEYRRSLVAGQSSRLIAAYVYASAGMYESTTDLVFSGHSMICENGIVHTETSLFQKESQLIWADADIELLMNTRRGTNSFMAHPKDAAGGSFRTVSVPLSMESPPPLRRFVNPLPFVPSDQAALDRRCGEIFAIQRTGLARRLLHTGLERPVIAVSGGLDSTLALLVSVRAQDFLGHSRQGILGVTMPGFGTTGRTYRNALALMEELGVEIREIDIQRACRDHLEDIGHNGCQDVTYENAQARERTQVVMDIANMEHGLVVGTGDLSELALGFTTYAGDHMSMYNVNCGVPKTLVRTLVDWVARSGQLGKAAADLLLDILDTPVSPELLPPQADDGIRQRTEDLIGPYELHDFFLYHMVRSCFAPDKILFLAEYAFYGRYSPKEIVKWMRLFYRRFFSQQFKRSCVPDGPKVGTVALSPRGDWRMPSDASGQVWLDLLDRMP